MRTIHVISVVGAWLFGSATQDPARVNQSLAVAELRERSSYPVIGHFGGSDPWADAERSAKDLIYYHEAFTKLNKEQIRALVTAIAQAEEAERVEISTRAAREASANVSRDFSKAQSRKDEALRLLDAVLKDTLLRTSTETLRI